ncbi:hypothetical protein [Mesorhizobium sp.]|uniref:hypothetical protein n=1 Tax=Mesorhizobium sp. TaxID=1871066 RepID=UPI0025C60C28|nr:hypothetical protein [Mesorhizobium sp.]
MVRASAKARAIISHQQLHQFAAISTVLSGDQLSTTGSPSASLSAPAAIERRTPLQRHRD